MLGWGFSPILAGLSMGDSGQFGVLTGKPPDRKGKTPEPPPQSDRIDSWKEIATYLGRDIRTVRRWEEYRGLPVHRVPGIGRRAVYAYRSEIDLWLRSENHPSDEDVAIPSARGSGEDESRSAAISAMPTRIPRWLQLAGLAGLILSLLLVAIFSIRPKMRLKANLAVSGEPAVPQGIEHWLRISLVNGQSESAPGPFQQLVVADSSKYARFEADNLQNIEFFDEHGDILPSWLESGNSKFSTSTVYWIQLSEGNSCTDSNGYLSGILASRSKLAKPGQDRRGARTKSKLRAVRQRLVGLSQVRELCREGIAAGVVQRYYSRREG